MANALVIYTSNGYVKLRGTVTGQMPSWDNDAGEWVLVTGGGGGGGSGTVTSVGLTGGTSGLVIGGSASPITSFGTFNINAPLRFAFNTATPTAVAAAGQVAWNDTEGSLESMLKGDTVVADLGQQLYQRVINDAGTALVKGEVVYVSGSSGTRVQVKRAVANADLTSATILGVVAETIADGQAGFVMTGGLMKGLSVLPTSGFTPGDVVYLSPATAGGLTTTKPTAPNHLVTVGYVAKTSNGSAGELLVHPQNGYELDELHNVKITSAASGNLLIYNGDSGKEYWENAALTGGTGVTITPGAGSLSVAIGQDVGTSSSVTFAQVTTAVFNSPTGVFDFTGGSGSTTYISPPAAATATHLSLEGGAASTGNANGGNAYLLGGLKFGSGTNGAVYIGTSNTSAITIGASGITTTVAGTLTAATAAVDTSTTQVATTAYVVGQGYLKSATAASTYQTQAGMASYLTTASAASTYAPLASPALTGTPTAPTASSGTNTTQVATCEFTTTAVSNAVGVPYDLPVELSGTPDTSTRVVNFKTVRAYRLASSGHQGGAVTPPTGTAVVCTVKKNNAAIGSGATITFNTDGTVTFSIDQTDFAAGDVLSVETPSNVYSIVTPFFTLAMTLL